MNWTNKLVALAAAMIILTPSAASAYYWYTPTRYYTPAVRTAAAAPAATPTASAATSVEQALVQLTNQERIKAGLAPLQLDEKLTSLARMKSADMVAKNYFSHTSPTYGTPAQMLVKNGVTYTAFAENIAKGSTAAQIHTMWMNSAGHRANIMNVRLNRIGIGAAKSGTGYAATQLFITR
ncbi:MAG: SCP-like extracellular protein [Symbiobacteriaceae bacterium]|jgi:uncharacterized YkwD family protein|nr:SCP-like extracellular protein [Symbiobacteriaceae bacterium]